MKSIAIVYHSGYGHTARQAQAVYEGAKSVEGTRAIIISVAEVDQHWDALNNADAIIFGAPTYLGSLSAEFKKFMESTSKLWSTRAWLDKLAAGFTNSGNLNGDKFNALVQLATFAAQHGMTWVNLAVLAPANVKSADRNTLNYLGGYMGALAQCDTNESAEIAPPQGDLDTAKYLGKRVAEMALRFH